MEQFDFGDEQEWLDEQEALALEYLSREGVSAPGGLEIEWALAPYVSLWTIPATRAAKTWVICGDLPTDYLREATVQNARSAARAFGHRWSEVAGYLLQGKPHPTVTIGLGLAGEELKDLGDLLRRRAELLVSWSKDPEKWVE